MILRAKYLITGDGRTCLQDQAVYLDKEGKIGWIGDAAEAAGRYPEEMVKDYGEATILPGLFDMHVHFGYYYSQPDLDNYDDYMVAYYALEQAKQSLRFGITTVRDLSCPPNLMKQLRLAGQKGYVTVPRIIHADAGICMTGGHGHQDGVEEADSPWGVRAAIRRQLRAGADWVKILTSNRGDIPEFTQEELDAAVDEAHRQGVKIAVHSGTQPSIQMCIDAGFDTIEHGTFLTEVQARQMAKKGIAWTPTITGYTRRVWTWTTRSPPEPFTIRHFSNRRLRHTGIILKSSMTQGLRCWQAAIWCFTRHRRFRFIRNSAIW